MPQQNSYFLFIKKSFSPLIYHNSFFAKNITTKKLIIDMSIQSQTLINPKLIIRLEIRFYSYLHDLWLLQLPYSKNWNMIIFEDKTERNLLFTTPQHSEQPDDYSFTPTIRWFRLHNQIYIICTVSKFATSQRENKILYDRSSNNQLSLKKQLTSGQTVKLLSIMIMMRNIGASAFIKTDFFPWEIISLHRKRRY